MNRRGFIGGLLSALAAPAVVRSGLLMPVSTFALPIYGPGGVLTPMMIAAEFNQRLQSRVSAAVNRGVRQSHVDFTAGATDLRMSLQEFGERFLAPSVAALADCIGQGELSVGMMPIPAFIPMVDCGLNERRGVFARAVHAYDVWNDAMTMRLDVMHS